MIVGWQFVTVQCKNHKSFSSIILEFWDIHYCGFVLIFFPLPIPCSQAKERIYYLLLEWDDLL